MKAFPSYIQAYSKHQASFIFRMNELDIPSIAYSWGLLKLPRMPELKSRQILWTLPSVDVFQSYEITANIQWENYAYADSQKEVARRNAADKKPDVRKEGRPEKKAWSEKTAVKEKREGRREKRKTIKDKLRREREEERIKELGEMQEELEEDWKELTRERKRAKKDKGKSAKESNVDDSVVEFDL